MEHSVDRNLKASLHLGYLDGVRACAAIFVVWHHALATANPKLEALPAWEGIPLGVLVYGHNAVDLFIVLSGFCLMLPVVRGDGTLKHGVADFLRRRAWRILPPYYGAILLSLGLIAAFIHTNTGTVWDKSLPVTAKSIYTHALLIQDTGDQFSTIDHPLWSIAVEWRIYFLFPLLVWSWRRYGAARTTAVAIVSSQLAYVGLKHWNLPTLSAHYVGLFATGMLGTGIAFSTERRFAKMRELPWNWLLCGLVAAVMLLLRVNVYHGRAMPTEITDAFVGFASMALLVVVSIHKDHPLHWALSSRPVVFMGTFAYSIYLIHAPLLQMLWQWMPWLSGRPLWMLAALVALGTPVIVFCSYLFFLVCERPFLRRKIAAPRSMIAKTVVEPAP